MILYFPQIGWSPAAINTRSIYIIHSKPFHNICFKRLIFDQWIHRQLNPYKKKEADIIIRSGWFFNFPLGDIVDTSCSPMLQLHIDTTSWKDTTIKGIPRTYKEFTLWMLKNALYFPYFLNIINRHICK